MRYKIGNPMTGNKQPEEYKNIEDAEEAIIEASIDDGLWGVWDEEQGYWVSLSLGGVLYTN